jgi:hypothetical protein
MKKLLVALMVIVSSVGFSQDTLDVVTIDFGSVTLGIHTESNQSLLKDGDHYVLSGEDDTFYITVDGSETFNIRGSHTTDVSLIRDHVYKVQFKHGTTLLLHISDNNISLGTIEINVKKNKRRRRN